MLKFKYMIFAFNRFESEFIKLRKIVSSLIFEEITLENAMMK